LQSKRRVRRSLPLDGVIGSARPVPCPSRPWPASGTGASDHRTQCLVIIRLDLARSPRALS
jgi:hypothetical protein